MYFYLAYLSYFVMFLSCGNIDSNGHHQLNRDTIFVNWNKATMLSLNTHIKSANDAFEKETYKNRLLAFKAFVDIKDYTEVNSKSIRYQFLQDLKDTNKTGNFYIIEANRSGESMEIRNYVVFLKGKNIEHAITYNFNNGKWIRDNNIKKIDLPVNNDLKSHFVKFGSGFNQDDVIITKFTKHKVSASEYYIYSTLSNTSEFKRILVNKAQ